MNPLDFQRSLELEADAEDVFRWHCRKGAFETLLPQWERVSLEGPAAPVEVGARQTVAFPLGPLRQRWLSEISEVKAGREFKDLQLSGPFASWEHTQSMQPADAGASKLQDSVRYALPLGGLGSLVAGRFVRRKLERMFAYRHRITAQDLSRHAEVAAPPADVLVSGSSGLVEKSLAAFLTTGGHRVRRLVRRVTNSDSTRVLGRVLRRPAVLPMPSFAARLAFGELANELLLASQRAAPKRLQETGYKFAQPDLEEVLRHQL